MSKSVEGSISTRRETDRTNQVYVEDICEEIMDLQMKGRYDLM
jgi:hypothetical protein